MENCLREKLFFRKNFPYKNFSLGSGPLDPPKIHPWSTPMFFWHFLINIVLFYRLCYAARKIHLYYNHFLKTYSFVWIMHMLPLHICTLLYEFLFHHSIWHEMIIFMNRNIFLLEFIWNLATVSAHTLMCMWFKNLLCPFINNIKNYSMSS